MHSLTTLTLEVPLGAENTGFWGTPLTPDIEMANADRDLKRYWRTVLNTDDETKYPVTIFLSKKELAEKQKEDVSYLDTIILQVYLLILYRASGAQKLEYLPRAQPLVRAVLDKLKDEELRRTRNDDIIYSFE